MRKAIHPETKLGAVYLTVSNLDQSLAFYRQALGFLMLKREDTTAHLGTERETLLVLEENPTARRVRGTTGLYHFAILVPSRKELACSIQRMARSGVRLQGASDHLVSEALYLADPDGNGIEIYRDRPNEEWKYRNGQLLMSTEPLDIDGILRSLDDSEIIGDKFDPATRIGHIHLHVADLDKSEQFYTQILGFDLVTRYGTSATFVSAGGYHHHIGMNTWAGENAPAPPPDAIGLRWFDILLPGSMEVEQVVNRLTEAQIPHGRENGWLFTRDPSSNGIRFRLAG